MTVPDRIAVYFDEQKPPIICGSVEELDDTLDRLEAQADALCPFAVSIIVPGYEIDMGLGSDLSFVCIQVEPCDGEYYLAVSERTEGETQMFYGAGQDSYWEPKNLIPGSSARDAVRYFVQNQERIPSIRWQDWNEDHV